ncbi:AraC family transcriptional regulator [Anaeromicropila populeti]|uniref:AraC-type DNA-binding protein n=1 Tax=Anaeromicropila populeti TaxID=37658 RepID=A0A1I6K0B9_9FIRM|nr:AraC family transcriptional regulator [Anaeromicropila populeti]SFR84651.1 AraC-type DNA-binding protein [Anaeromicropila populeti]
MQFLDYNECRQRGTFDFPIEYHYVDSTHPQYTMPYHWHIEYEIIRILEGTFMITLDEKEMTAEQGDILLIKDGVLHGGVPNNCCYECIVFDMKMLVKENDICSQFIHQITEHQTLLHSCFKNSAANKNLHFFADIIFHSISQKPPGYQLLAKSGLYGFIGFLFQNKLYDQNTYAGMTKQNQINALKKALTLIEQSYSSTLTLEALSKAANMSPKYFCRFFKAMTHKTPIDYLNYYRIERAAYLIATSDLPITTVSYICGFNDLSYFIKLFKRYKGSTPKKYATHSMNMLP